MRSKYLFVLILTASGIIIFLVGYFLQNIDQRSIFENYLKNEYARMARILDESRSGQPDDAGYPDMASMQNYLMTVDPSLQRVPVERLLVAYRYSNELREKQKLLGVKNTISWQSTGADMGGRTRAIVFDPGEPSGNKVWAGGVTGGLWYNNDITDPGTGWVNVNDFWPSLSVSCIAFDPANADVFYVGTGEAQTAIHIYRESSSVGIGIWKTTDGGTTWNLLTSTEGFKYITDIKVRNESGTSVIYAGVMSGTYHGIPHPSNPGDGLFRSADGGITWEQVLPDITGENEPYAPADIEITAGNRIFIGTTKNLEGNGGSVILFSDEGTAGTWTVFDDYLPIIQNDPEYYIPDRVILASAPSNPSVVYALLGAGYLTSAGFNFSKGRYILRSGDAGNNWVQKNIPDNDPEWATLAWHALAAGVDPGDPNVLFVGGKDVYKSVNGGISWSRVSDWTLMYSGGGDEYVHCDQHTQTFWQGSSSEVLFTNDGGVFYTSSAQSSEPVFEERNKNYNTLQFYTCDIYPVAGQDFFVGGLQDNGTLLYQGNPLEVGDMIDVGDGAYCFFDEDEPSIMITSHYYNRYKIFLNWELYANIDDYYSGVFISPADYDSDLNILYANAVTFTNSNANKILRISGIPYVNSGTYVNLNTGLNVYFSFLKVSPFSPVGTSTLFIGSQNGRLFKATNAQATPQTSEIGGSSFPAAYISCVAVGGSEDTLLVTFSNYGVPKIWQTYNGGLNWHNKTGNLPDMPVRWAIYHPDNAREALIATELGVWRTTNLDSEDVTWEPEINGMANVRVDMLQMRNSDHTILAASHGRGLFWANWEQSAILPVADFTADNTSIMQGQSVQFSDLSNGNPDSWEWSFENGDPSSSFTQTPPPITYITPGYHTVSLTVSNSAGSDTRIKQDYIFVQPVSDIENQDASISLKYVPYLESIFIRGANHPVLNAEIFVYNSSGKMSDHKKINISASQEIIVPVHFSGPGTYLISLDYGGKRCTLKVVAGL